MAAKNIKRVTIMVIFLCFCLRSEKGLVRLFGQIHSHESLFLHTACEDTRSHMSSDYYVGACVRTRTVEE